MYSSWRYYLYGDKKDLRVAKKYIERNKILKKSDKFQDIYINNLKNQSILYRANLNIKKAIKNHEDILNALNCFNSREVQKKERLCDEEKLNYSVLLMDTGKEKILKRQK